MSQVYQLTQAKFLDESEWQDFERLCRRQLTTENERDALALLLLLRTGARAAELLALTRNDFYERHSTVLIRGVKGSKDREISLPDWLARAAGRFIVNRLEGDLLSPISYSRLRQIWLWYRPCKKPLHSLRHTFGLNMYLHTRDIRAVQLALGHRRIDNTLIYTDYVFSRQQLKKMVF
jgi:integrase/recombinase XerD